jgi:hypothetical protein
MSTVFSNPATQWPLLQSITEQKFKSGLFNVSAKFVCPVGIGERPEQIETSIGPVDVWPEPVVSTGNDGLQTITATGYGVWDNQITEVTFGYELSEVYIVYTIREYCYSPSGCQGNGSSYDCGQLMDELTIEKRLDVILETAHVRKIGTAMPQIPSRPSPTGSAPITGLRVFDLSLNDITNKEIKISEINPYFNSSGYDGTFEKKIETQISPKMVKRNEYGLIVETEVVYNLQTQIDFGIFSTKPQPCS